MRLRITGFTRESVERLQKHVARELAATPRRRPVRKRPVFLVIEIKSGLLRIL
jgi:hypothetical protein